jgi:hypothetical protein
MPNGDLSNVTTMEDKQRTVLADKLGITSCYELILAERRQIVAAFGRRTNRPGLEDVAEWQDEARRVRAAATAAAEWEQVGLFVVAFEQRHRGEEIERRIVAERTEADPEDTMEWLGWACTEACRWMVERATGSTEPETHDDAQRRNSAKQPEAIQTRAVTSPRIEIERARLSDASGGIDLVSNARVVSPTRDVWTQPTRLVVTLKGASASGGTSVALDLVQPGGPSPSFTGRIESPGHPAVIELTGVADGTYSPAIIAWSLDGSATPRVVKLPSVRLLR